MGGRYRQSLPREHVTVEIENLSHEGRGVAHREGKTIFIDGALPNETVSFQYTRMSRRFDEGKTISVISPSSERVTPKCPHFSVCGGCSLQHMPASSQIEFKEKVLLEQLQHIAQTRPQTQLAPLTANAFGYRRKARLGVRFVEKKNRLLIGFRDRENPRLLVEMNRCDILHPAIGEKIEELSQLLSPLSIAREIAQLEVAIGDDTTAVILRHLKPFSENDLAVLHDFAIAHSLQIYLQPHGPDSIHLLQTLTHKPLSYALPEFGMEFLFQPTDFTQVNGEINRLMVSRAIELLDPQTDDIVLDLFCGLGNFSLPIAKRSQHVIGIEGYAPMVERAYANAKHNAITNVEFHCADLTKAINTRVLSTSSFNKILLDPPRTGAIEIIPQIAALGATRIVYISCNPATLARDSGALISHGYQMKAAGVMDMFPHTTHVESIAVFERHGNR